MHTVNCEFELWKVPNIFKQKVVKQPLEVKNKQKTRADTAQTMDYLDS